MGWIDKDKAEMKFSLPKRERSVGIAIAISGCLTVLLAALAGIDAWCCQGALEFASWGGSQRMAIPTGVCFVLVGSALVLIAEMFRERHK